MEGLVFWDITMYSPLKSMDSFGGITYIHTCFFPGSFFNPEDGGNMFP
jgi:hypothetical protein